MHKQLYIAWTLILSLFIFSSLFGLLIFSSDKEFTLQPKKGTQLTLNLAETWIEVMAMQ